MLPVTQIQIGVNLVKPRRILLSHCILIQKKVVKIAAPAKTLNADIAHGERKGLESLLSIPLGLAGKRGGCYPIMLCPSCSGAEMPY